MTVKPASLDEWYRLINSIYMDRNFYRTHDSVFTHLIEVSGGLSSSASHKVKVSSDANLHIGKAIGWWLALCGHVGVKSVEAMLWKKFPFVCPYCQKAAHDRQNCKASRSGKNEIAWKDLDRIGLKNEEENRRPHSLREWQKMFYDIYIYDYVRDKPTIFGRLAEELGELAEAIRLIPASPAYFMNEAVDVFGWLMRYANYEDEDNVRDPKSTGEELEEILWTEYPGKCRYCKEEVCKCPTILIETLGRISREMPLDAYSGTKELGLFTHDQKIELFRLSGKVLQVGELELKQTTQLLDEINRTNNAVLQQIQEMNTKFPKDLEDALIDFKDLASQQTVTQQIIDSLSSALEKSPLEVRTLILDFLSGVSAGMWVEAIKLLIINIAR